MQGHADNPLNEKGFAQAALLADHLIARHPDMAALYSSDLKRAYSTAQAAAQRFSLPIASTPTLREYQWGDVDGWQVPLVFSHFRLETDRLKEIYPERKQRWDHTVYPNSETFNDLLNRVRDQLISISQTHPEEKVAVFSHYRAIRTLLADALDKEIEQIDPLSNCAIVHLLYSPETNTFRMGEIETPTTP
jgi:probable phosphoglycerate mutase